MFTIATEADLTVTPYGTKTPEIVPVGGPYPAAFELMVQILDADVKLFAHRKITYPELEHSFILMLHTNEMALADQLVVDAIRPYVRLAEIELGIPASYNFNLYVSDIAALGLSPRLVSESDAINSQVRQATKIVYMRESNGTL